MIRNLMDKISNKKVIVSVVIVLVILELLFIYLAIVSYNNKNLDKYIFGNKDLKSTSLFAIMVEDSNGEFVEQSTFPNFPYQFNLIKSSCIDREGNKIKDSMFYDEENKQVTVKTNKSIGCYLFFNKPKEIAKIFSREQADNTELWQSGLDGDGYRYVGSGSYDSETSPANFICFGTYDKNECKNNESKYLYRIIGIFPNESNNMHAKLISFKQIGSLVWDSNYSSNISWENSELFQGLNGSYFLTNTTFNYLQDNEWLDKIENWTWSAVNTQTSGSSTKGPDYFNELSPSQIYLHELNTSTKNSSIGIWTTPVAKIGLMYVSDYTLSLGTASLEISGNVYDNDDLLKTGWIHPSNNDTSKGSSEWTMARYGKLSSNYRSYAVESTGSIGYNETNGTYGIRPSFYLMDNVKMKSGTGTYSDPYVFSNDLSNKLDIKTTIKSNIVTATITKGTADLNKYCLNNSSKTYENCSWKKITSTNITETLSSYGNYYIHVIDNDGYLVHSDKIEYINKLSTKLVDSASLWQSGLEKDGYRYVGAGSYDSDTTPNNFICFGTSDKATCKGDESKYLYRIIGVFPDGSGNNHLKLISFNSLGTMEWNYRSSGYLWSECTLHEKLNGSDFLTNATYDYLQNSIWLNKIENWIWISAVTETTSSSSDYPDYVTMTSSEVYLHELNKKSKTNNYGLWNIVTSKIGLMYVSDYMLSLGSESLSYTGSSDKTTLKTSWLHISNRGCKSCNEWTIAHYGQGTNILGTGKQYSWGIASTGGLSEYLAHSQVSSPDSLEVRPVFYLTNDVLYNSGTGTYADPYIISE